MNITVLKFILKTYSATNNRKGFVNFVWWAAVVSVSLGVVALIISLSVLDGFYNAILENAIRFTSHIRIYTFNRKPIAQPDSVVNKIKRDITEVESAYPSITKEVLLRTKDFVEGISLQSLNEKNVSNLRKIEITDIKNLREIDGILVGKVLADRLGLNIGDSVLLVSLQIDSGSQFPVPKFIKTKVEGFFESGMAKYDDLFAFANEKTFSKILGDSVSLVNSIDVYLNDIKKVDTVAQKIEAILGYPFYCFSFYDLHSSIFAWIELQKEPIPLVLSLITIVAVFNVVTFLLVNIVEKTKSIGIFTTIGLTSKEISLIFLFLGLKIALIGLGFGLFFSLSFSLLQMHFGIIQLDSKVYFFSKLPITISVQNYLLVCVFTLVLTFVTSLIPSIIASKINPVKALRFVK